MSRSIYFCGSIRGGRQDVRIYDRIIELLSEYGKVVSEDRIGTGPEHHVERSLSDKEIHDRDTRELDEADYVVAEVTQPSLGVGYEVACCVRSNNPTLCLFRPSSGRHLSAMIRGAAKENVSVVDYEAKDLPEIFKNFFKK
ncbi:DNPH1 (predicted) [Pycnogonum litorale]